MGLPAGHVTKVPDLSRSAQLKALGAGVVPQQGVYALRLLTVPSVHQPALTAHQRRSFSPLDLAYSKQQGQSGLPAA